MTGVGIFWMFVTLLMIAAALAVPDLRTWWWLMTVGFVWIWGADR